MTGSWKHPKYDPTICAQINADIEATCHERIGDRIDAYEKAGHVWKAESLRQKAQQEFNFMVSTNGKCLSRYADIREEFKLYTQSDNYQPFDTKAELEKRFDVTTDPETGQYLIHPKGMKNITPAVMPEGWKPWARSLDN